MTLPVDVDAALPSSPPGRNRVLLVDDEPQVLVALEDLLSDRFVVMKTGSPEQALDILKEHRDIAVVVTDQRMPKMTGDELLSRSAEASDAQRILLTGFADLSAVVRAVNEGRISAYVTKPWNPDDLQLKVQQAAEHFRLARELAYERTLLHDLMDNVPDGIYFKDVHLRFRRANQAFSRMIAGAPPDAIVGRRLTEFSPDEAMARVTEAEERRVLETGTPRVDALGRYASPDGSRWLSETLAPVRDQHGEIVGLVGVSRDVTERITTGEALEASEKRFREQTRILNSILESMGEGVVAVSGARHLLAFNRQAQKLLGAPRGETLPPDWTSRSGMLKPDGRTPLGVEEDPLLRAVAGEDVRESEVVVRNDTTRDAIIAIAANALVDDTGGLAGGIALLRDVTKQRVLERQFAQAQKMEAVGRLAGGVAHDFNNLLAVIHSYIELLMNRQDFPADVRADLEEVLGAAQRAAALTRQLLAFSRRQVVQPKNLQLNEVVASVEKMLRRIIGEDVELATRPLPGLGLVRADAGQMEQVIVNLTINARDAMPQGGKLTIETANVTLESAYLEGHPSARGGDFVMLAVTDSGVGMDEETKRRIFEPFFTTKEVGKGTGLGLSTVYGIVEQSGGHIVVYSEPNQGTSFKIYLPRIDGVPVASSAGGSMRSPVPGSGTVLLVEDDEAVRRIALRILKECGYTVIEARRSSEARRVIESGTSVDLLLTDVVMPEQSGPDLARELRAARPSMRVLFMSGYPGAAVVREGLIAPDTPYVEKPFSPTTLADKVRDALTR
ncbi:MAG TPA: response regulator [Polyangiaceae bacterium]|nr:response regulator [Polyangiaceae bacterium]